MLLRWLLFETKGRLDWWWSTPSGWGLSPGPPRGAGRLTVPAAARPPTILPQKEKRPRNRTEVNPADPRAP